MTQIRCAGCQTVIEIDVPENEAPNEYVCGACLTKKEQQKIVQCLTCTKALVKELAYTLPADEATKNLPPVYLCGDCSQGKQQPKQVDQNTLTKISGVCYVFKKTDDPTSIQRAVDDAQEDVKNLRLVSYGESKTLVDQNGFELVITKLWIEEGKILYEGTCLLSKSGRKLAEEINTSGKQPEIRLRWSSVKEAKKTSIDMIWVESTDMIDEELVDLIRRKIVIDSVYVYRKPAPKKKVVKKRKIVKKKVKKILKKRKK